MLTISVQHDQKRASRPSNACLDGCPIANVIRMPNHTRTGGLCDLGCIVPRAVVNYQHLERITSLSQRLEDPADNIPNHGRFIESWNNHRDVRRICRYIYTA